MYNKFWHQVIDGVSRPQTSTAFDVQMTTDGDRGHVLVEAVDKDNSFNNFVDFEGTVAGGPELKTKPVHLVQTGPGMYEADFDAKEAGNYICYLNYVGQRGANGEPPPTGRLLAGTVVNTSPEMRDLQSNEALLQQVAESTGGRVLEPLAARGRQPVRPRRPAAHRQPAAGLNYLIPLLLGLIILDVAVRRIAWDWESIKKLSAAGAAHVRNFTVATLAKRPEGQTRSLDALKRVRGRVRRGPGEGRRRPGRAGRPVAASGPQGQVLGQAGRGRRHQPASSAAPPTSPSPPPPRRSSPRAPPAPATRWAACWKPSAAPSSRSRKRNRASERRTSEARYWSWKEAEGVNDETRNQNDERMTHDETRRVGGSLSPLVIRASSFIRHSDFWFRISLPPFHGEKFFTRGIHDRR